METRQGGLGKLDRYGVFRDEPVFRVQDHIRQDEREADLLERELKYNIFAKIKDALVVYHLIHLVDIVQPDLLECLL